MMAAWVTCFRVPPPVGRTIMVRFGAVVFDAAYSVWQRKWFMCEPGGRETEIEAPQLWFCRDAEASIQEARVLASQETTSARKRKGPAQLVLDFAQSDSKTLSSEDCGPFPKRKEAA
jgi:hypothetical protein